MANLCPTKLCKCSMKRLNEELQKRSIEQLLTAYALTNSPELPLHFTYDKWFESNKDRFFTFAVQYGSGTENYEIWSAGRTVRQVQLHKSS